MIDRADYTDHRMNAAKATNQSNGRGYAFDRMIDESPMWLRAIAEICRPRSLVILAVIGAVVAVWWL